MTFRDVEKILKQDGWTLKSIQGSHHQYTHSIKPGKITIPRHNGDLDMRTVK